MSMRKLIFTLLAALGLTLCFSGALAAEAMDITSQCTLRCSPNSIPSKNLTDGQYTTKAVLRKTTNPWVSVAAPAGLDIHGLYICCASMPDSYEVQVDYGNGNGWEKYIDGETRFYHVFIPLNGVKNVRLYCTSAKSCSSSPRGTFPPGCSAGSPPPRRRTSSSWPPTPMMS